MMAATKKTPSIASRIGVSVTAKLTPLVPSCYPVSEGDPIHQFARSVDNHVEPLFTNKHQRDKAQCLCTEDTIPLYGRHNALVRTAHLMPLY